MRPPVGQLPGTVEFSWVHSHRLFIATPVPPQPNYQGSQPCTKNSVFRRHKPKLRTRELRLWP